MSERSIFSGMQILIERKWVKQQAVIVEGEKIKAIIPEDMIKHHLPACHYEFSDEHYLTPGLIDLHIHGAGGKDVMDAEATSLLVIAKCLASEGVTSFLATTMVAPKEKIEAVLKLMPNAMLQKEGAAILGIHLEGPFIAQEKLGAQPPNILAPDPELIVHWQNMAQGAIKIVTLAPELPGALPLIKKLREIDVIASIGHSNATYEEALAAIAAGCSQGTHLFNAMSGLQHREPGVALALLLAPEVDVELILDRHHVHPAMIELAYRLKHKEHIFLVTDAIPGKCMPDGNYQLGGQAIKVSNGCAKLANGRLAGSVLRMPEAIKNMHDDAHCSLIDAIEMASINPARALGIDDRKGSIDVGKDADLVIFNSALDVLITLRSGRAVFKR